MSTTTQIKIRVRDTDGNISTAVEPEFLRRDYSRTVELKDLAVTTSRATVYTGLSTVTYLYIEITGTDTTVNFYQNLSPEALVFGQALLLVDLSGVTSFSLAAAASTTVRIFAAGT